MIIGRFRRRATASKAASHPTGSKHAARETAEAGAEVEPARRRHAIFYDVENTSSPDDVSHVMSRLAMDRVGAETQLVAVGNWRVIGQQTARLLARHGAELVHSAPSTGVRDWSDLRIAVDAGIWLGAARPGDVLHIVSDDQAFDAVGDVAATLGVQFHRVPTRERAATHTAPEHTRARGRAAADTVRQASHDDILAFVRRLTANDPSGQGVTLDALSNELKDAGFVRPPGSLRLITRLRRIKELRVGPDGLIQIASSAVTAKSTEAEPETAEGQRMPRRRPRRGRRGGRRRSGRNHGESAESPSASCGAATGVDYSTPGSVIV